MMKTFTSALLFLSFSAADAIKNGNVILYFSMPLAVASQFRGFVEFIGNATFNLHLAKINGRFDKLESDTAIKIVTLDSKLT